MAHDVPIRSAEEIAMARRAGRLAAEVLGMVEPFVVPGVSTEALDRICHDHIVKIQEPFLPTSGTRGIPRPSSPP